MLNENNFLICTIKYGPNEMFTLLAASIAFNPNGQQQNRQERTAGTIQS